MRVVKGVAVSSAGCANAEAVLVEVLDDSRVRQGLVEDMPGNHSQAR